MGKRFWSLVLSTALIGGVFSALPARAQGAPATVIPDLVQIDDPKGDANLVNDQDNAYGTPAAGQGDHVGPADIGTATDIMKVWFANTATDITLNIQLEGDPSKLAYDTYFRFSSNAGEGPVAKDTTRGCLQWIASVNGTAGAYSGPTEGNLTDKCNVGTPVTGPLLISPADTGFVISITFPRAYSPLLMDGSTITAPFGVSRVLYASLPATPATGTTAAFVTMDNTKRGTDYTITSGGSVTPEPAPTAGSGKEEGAPGTETGKPKAKGCKKGKGKKKGCKAKPPASSCPAYVPGEEGAEAATTVVTAAATEEKPVEVEIDAPAGIPEVDIGSVFQNIQVDADGSEAGLYARYEFPVYEDHDIYLNYASGSEAAHAGGFNPAPFVSTPVFSTDGKGTGGHSEQGAEVLDGIRTPDCAGYTLKMNSYASEGGKMTLKLWLGEAQNDPAPDEGAQVLGSSFYGYLMSF